MPFLAATPAGRGQGEAPDLGLFIVVLIKVGVVLCFGVMPDFGFMPGVWLWILWVESMAVW
jgi:hypothetical protein